MCNNTKAVITASKETTNLPGVGSTLCQTLAGALNLIVEKASLG